MLAKPEKHHNVNLTAAPVFERLLAAVDVGWKPYLTEALHTLPPAYINHLLTDTHWLPGPQNMLRAFSLPLHLVNYVLFGESPYPRATSANGYAFWDNAVQDIWSPTGLSKEVNRATSLRNMVKMLLVADHKLSIQDTSQTAIAKLDKTGLITTGSELFANMLHHGILLLNACPVLSERPVIQEARFWHDFVNQVLSSLSTINPHATLILLGNIAKQIKQRPASTRFTSFCAEHPYNLSFVSNPAVIEFFKPLNLLSRRISKE